MCGMLELWGQFCCNARFFSATTSNKKVVKLKVDKKKGKCTITAKKRGEAVVTAKYNGTIVFQKKIVVK